MRSVNDVIMSFISHYCLYRHTERERERERECVYNCRERECVCNCSLYSFIVYFLVCFLLRIFFFFTYMYNIEMYVISPRFNLFYMFVKYIYCFGNIVMLHSHANKAHFELN